MSRFRPVGVAGHSLPLGGPLRIGAKARIFLFVALPLRTPKHAATPHVRAAGARLRTDVEGASPDHAQPGRRDRHGPLLQHRLRDRRHRHVRHGARVPDGRAGRLPRDALARRTLRRDAAHGELSPLRDEIHLAPDGLHRRVALLAHLHGLRGDVAFGRRPLHAVLVPGLARLVLVPRLLPPDPRHERLHDAALRGGRVPLLAHQGRDDPDLHRAGRARGLRRHSPGGRLARAGALEPHVRGALPQWVPAASHHDGRGQLRLLGDGTHRRRRG